MLSRVLLLSVFISLAAAQGPTDRVLDLAIAQADAFHQHARGLVAEELLVQRCYRIPEHSHFAIGAAAVELPAQNVTTVVTSDYSIGALKNDNSGNLAEFREVLKKNGKDVQPRAAARKALQMDVAQGESRVHKKMLAVFSDLGLLDVATDYGLILLAFTRAAVPSLRIEPAGVRYFGTEEAAVFEWTQTEGGLLELRGKKPVRLPMHGQLWVRLADGTPLRITSTVLQDVPKHRIRDDATVEFVRSASNCVTPAIVVHRHYVDEALLTENLYSYGPFRLFQTDTTIRYGEPPGK